MSSPDPASLQPLPVELSPAETITVSADPPEQPIEIADQDTDEQRPVGVPGWLVLAALVIALVVSVFVVTRIGSSLSALVSPPEPVLPAQAVLQSQGTDHVGDYWVYATSNTGCMTAKFYQDHLGHCNYSPASGCSPDGGSGNGYPISGPMSIAQCDGSQLIGQYHVSWQVDISVNNNTSQSLGTTFRIYRDLG